jgi:hypothetical protein
MRSSSKFSVLSFEFKRFLNQRFKNIPQLRTQNPTLKTSGHLPSILGLAAILGTGFALFAGCTSKTPFDAAGFPGLTPTPNVTPVYPAPTLVPNRALVANFNNGSVAINPNLMEMNNPPNYVLNLAGMVTLVNNFPSNIVVSVASAQLGGTDGSPYAFNGQGTITDPGNATYPAIELEAQMEGGKNYDGSFFTGVQFYLKIAADDNTTKRDFSIPVAQTEGVLAGGTCTGTNGACYDNFTTDLSSGTAGQWKAFNIPYSSLAQAYAGVITTPDPHFGGQNLQQMMWLQWEESRNNQAGTSHFDYWVDNIEFY